MPSFMSIAFASLAAGAVAMAIKAPARDAPPLPAYYTAVTKLPDAVAAPPDVDALPDDAAGLLVRRGRDLIARTPSLIGPDAADPAMRFAGNGLACASCHLQAGTQPFGLALTETFRAFPRFVARENETRTLSQRIDGCMERSMNGRKLPPEGAEMAAMLAYMKFIGGSAKGRDSSLAPIAWPDQAADPVHGKAVFETTCAACHGAAGQGQRLGPADVGAEGKRYRFPPLWGPDSYNDGAGMARTITAARFVRSNMPLGTTWQSPLLSMQDAFDVMAYVNSQPRPKMAGLEADFPDRAKKPVDAAYPPFVGPFPPEQHRIGPWRPIEAWLKESGAEARTMD